MVFVDSDLIMIYGRKKEIFKFAKSLIIVLGCWLIVLYAKFNSFARETSNEIAYEERLKRRIKPFLES